MGDSYAAGVGLGSVTAGCDRDDYAYAPRAKWDILPTDFTINPFTFVACSGAVTTDIKARGAPDLWEDQLPAVNSTMNVATLTIGGNDIGFGNKLAGCGIGECGPDLYGLQSDVEGGTQTWDDVFNRLVTTYIATRNRMSSSGHLYVVSYPIPFARATNNSCAGLSSNEQNAANALVTRLDDTIWLAVQRANELLPSVHGRAGNVQFVEWRTGTRVENGYTIESGYPGAGGSFASYRSPDGLCNGQGRTPFINGYTTTGGSQVSLPASAFGNSFHPNSTGYWYAAQRVADAIRADFTPSAAPPGGSPTPPSPQPPNGVYVSTCNLGGADHCSGVNLRSRPQWPGYVIGTLPENTRVTPECYERGYRNTDANGVSDDRWAWVSASGGRAGFVNFRYLWGPSFTVYPCYWPAGAAPSTLAGIIRQYETITFNYPLLNDGRRSWTPTSARVAVRRPDNSVSYAPCLGAIPTLAPNQSWTCSAPLTISQSGAHHAWVEWIDPYGSWTNGSPPWTSEWGWDFTAPAAPLEGTFAAIEDNDPRVTRTGTAEFLLRNRSNTAVTIPYAGAVVRYADGTGHNTSCDGGPPGLIQPGAYYACIAHITYSTEGDATVRFEYQAPDGHTVETAFEPLFVSIGPATLNQDAPSFALTPGDVHVEPYVGGNIDLTFTVTNTAAKTDGILPGLDRIGDAAFLLSSDCDGVDYLSAPWGVALGPGESFTCEYHGVFQSAGHVDLSAWGWRVLLDEDGGTTLDINYLNVFEGLGLLASIDVASEPDPVPAAPASVTVTQTGETSLGITVEFASDPAATEFPSFEAECSTGNPAETSATTMGGNTEGAFLYLDGVTPGAEYACKARAVNAAGPGAYTTAAPIVVARPPGPPQSVQVAVDGSNALVTFDPPSDDGGAPPIKYFVACYTWGDSSEYRYGESTTSPITVRDLLPGVAYWCYARAINIANAGTFANPPGPVTVPTAPSALSCPPDDALEPNDTVGGAVRIASGASIEGIVCTINDDYFKVDASVGDLLTIQLDFSHAVGDLDLQLFAPNGWYVGGSWSVTDEEVIQLNAAQTGEYIVRVFGVSGAAGAYAIAGSVTSPQMGMLRVATSPAVPSRLSVDGLPRADWGLDWVSIPIGTHELCFSDVLGFATPECRSVTVTEGQTTTVVGEFAQLGLLQVAVSPAGLPVTVFIDGVARDEYGLYSYIDPGTHEVCWGDVSAHQAPGCQTIDVTAGGQITVVGTFTPSESPDPGPAPPPSVYGYLRVTTSPAVPAAIIVDGVRRTDWGLTWMKIETGSHEVCFTAVVGFVTPSCHLVWVSSDQTTDVVGRYRPLGLLRVAIAPAGLPVDVFIDGVPSNQFGLYTYIESGDHLVCARSASNFVFPSCETVRVNGGQQTDISLEFVPTY